MSARRLVVRPLLEVCFMASNSTWTLFLFWYLLDPFLLDHDLRRSSFLNPLLLSLLSFCFLSDFFFFWFLLVTV